MITITRPFELAAQERALLGASRRIPTENWQESYLGGATSNHVNYLHVLKIATSCSEWHFHHAYISCPVSQPSPYFRSPGAVRFDEIFYLKIRGSDQQKNTCSPELFDQLQRSYEPRRVELKRSAQKLLGDVALHPQEYIWDRLDAHKLRASNDLFEITITKEEVGLPFRRTSEYRISVQHSDNGLTRVEQTGNVVARLFETLSLRT